MEDINNCHEIKNKIFEARKHRNISGYIERVNNLLIIFILISFQSWVLFYLRLEKKLKKKEKYAKNSASALAV